MLDLFIQVRFSIVASENSSRTALLAGISTETLGSIGNAFLSVLVALACFTTAIGIVTGTADFVKGLAGNSQTAYVLTALLSSLLGVIMGQFDVQYIIAVAVPALMVSVSCNHSSNSVKC